MDPRGCPFDRFLEGNWICRGEGGAESLQLVRERKLAPDAESRHLWSFRFCLVKPKLARRLFAPY